jgi:hypothetical protein
VNFLLRISLVEVLSRSLPSSDISFLIIATSSAFSPHHPRRKSLTVTVARIRDLPQRRCACPDRTFTTQTSNYSWNYYFQISTSIVGSCWGVAHGGWKSGRYLLYTSSASKQKPTCGGLEYVGAVQLDWQQIFSKDHGALCFPRNIGLASRRSRSRMMAMVEPDYPQHEWNMGKGYLGRPRHFGPRWW